MKIAHIEHLFMPNQTIMAVIRMYNNMINDEAVLNTLAERFNELNDNKVPRVGTSFKVPVVNEGQQT